MTLRERTLRDLATARARLASLRQAAAILVAEVLVALTAFVWGIAVWASGRMFGEADAYRAFAVESEMTWAAGFMSLAVVSLYVTLTRGRQARFVTMGVTSMLFAQMIYRMIAGGQSTTGPYMYALWGIVLPIVVGLWHLAMAMFDDEEAREMQ